LFNKKYCLQNIESPESMETMTCIYENDGQMND
jgi:hypothetical protein